MSETYPHPERPDHPPLPRLLKSLGETAYVNVQEVPTFHPLYTPSSLHELQRLARVKAEGEIGAFGPSLAAIALERPDDNVSAELRKYEALFGRDSLRVALDVLPIYPLLTHATIHSLASLQGTTTHAAREEEPGRIVHEYRTLDDPVARDITDAFGWEWPYYGSVDATPQFMHAIYEYIRHVPNGDTLLRESTKGLDGRTKTIGDAYRDALVWVENRLNSNPEGLLEYKTALPLGIENQVWRDSWDGYFHADGTLANHDSGIASIEVQQLTFDALREAAYIHENLWDDREKAAHLRARAERLRNTIIDTFWVEEKGGYFALGTDRNEQGSLRRLEIRTSNMGHLLNSNLLAGEEFRSMREAIVGQLFSPEMLNISGIRTLATDEVRFRPGAYHNGSVWLWDTYYCAEGLRRHGYYGLANHLANKIHMVVNVTQKFPEYVRGDDMPFPVLNPRIVDIHDDTNGRINRVEQPPQEVQAWSVAAEVRRDYFSGRVPARAYDARAAKLEDTLLAITEEREARLLAR